MSDDMCWGLVIGFIIAGVLGLISQQMRIYRGRMRAADRPMSVQTTQTPRQVMTASGRAGCSYAFWLAVMVALVVGGVYLALAFVL